jgi:curved DNA-binding protein CbpA
VTDCFALLHEPRRPWLDPGALKARFLALSATAHPDRTHTADAAARESAHEHFAELNAAFQCLREPKERLKHLLELELGSRPQQVETVPNDLMELSMTVARLCCDTDGFLQEKARASSPLLQVQLFERGQQYSEQIGQLQSQLSSRRDPLIAELKAVDAEWDLNGNPGQEQRDQQLRSLGRIYRLLRYFDRWQQQLQERFVRLSL